MITPAERPKRSIKRVARRELWGVAALFAIGLSGCGALRVAAPALGTNDQATISTAQSYLDQLRAFRARFTQSGADGYAEGNVWLARPGRLRVDYISPRPKLLLANRGRLLLADQTTGATTTMPVSNTPLDILLADKIDLSGAVTVTSVQRFDTTFQLTLVKSNAPSQGRLTLQFEDAPLALIGVVVQDSAGHTNTLRLSDMVRDPSIDPSIFHYYPATPAG
jgi:outer membrane lipoprotein-sorting protein